jgi:hypothetical protein
MARASTRWLATKSTAWSGSVSSSSGQLAFEAVAVLGLAHAGFQAAQHAQLALDRDAAAVGHLDHLAGDVDIVLVAGRGLGVFHQRAVHHHRGEAVLDGGGAGRGAVAVVLVHADRDVRIDVDQGVDHLGQHDVVGVGAGAARGLDDDRRVDGSSAASMIARPCSMLLMLKAGQAVVVLGRVVEQLSQRDARHVFLPAKVVGRFLFLGPDALCVLCPSQSPDHSATPRQPLDLSLRPRRPEGLALHPLQERAASGRDEGQFGRHAGVIHRRDRVTAAGHGDQFTPALASEAASFAAATVAASKGGISKTPSGPFQIRVREGPWRLAGAPRSPGRRRGSGRRRATSPRPRTGRFRRRARPLGHHDVERQQQFAARPGRPWR